MIKIGVSVNEAIKALQVMSNVGIEAGRAGMRMNKAFNDMKKYLRREEEMKVKYIDEKEEFRPYSIIIENEWEENCIAKLLENGAKYNDDWDVRKFSNCLSSILHNIVDRGD